MTTVAIVAEYNPFHNGHLYQINAIRDIFGEDTCIISIMSGNYTQRGEVAESTLYLNYLSLFQFPAQNSLLRLPSR